MLATPARLGPGGWPCHPIFHGGPLRLVGDAAGGSAMCRGGQGASARTTTTTYYQLHLFPAATTTTNYLLPERVGAAEQGGACEGCPRHARGRRGRRSLHFQVPPAMVPGTNLLGPKLSRNDAKASPPGARRKGRRALLPLATVRSRAEGIPRTNSKRVFSAKGQSQPAMQRGSSVASG